MKSPHSWIHRFGWFLIFITSSISAWASVGEAGAWETSSLGKAVLSTIIFGVVGMILAIGGFKLFDLVIKFDLEKEICEKHNTAAAILSAGIVMGICIVVAAAIV